MTTPSPDFLLGLGWQPDRDSCLVVSPEKPQSLMDVGGSRIHWVSDYSTVADLEGLERHAIALVAGQLSVLPGRQAIYLLACLRDRYANRVVIVDSIPTLNAQELLALGYIHQQPAPEGAVAYIHDPNEYHATREWNNASSWANPENFGRYRW